MHPELSPILPLIYVAWADGDLADAERDSIRQLGDAWGIDADLLTPWIDPDTPPSAADLRAIRARCTQLGAAGTGLPGLSAALAQANGVTLPADAAASLSKVADALHLHHADGIEELLPRPTDPTEWPGIEGDPALSAAIAEAIAPSHPVDRADAVRAVSAFQRVLGEDTVAARTRVTGWMQALAEQGLFARTFPGTAPDAGISRFMAMFDVLATFDLSLTVKAGVQVGLFGGSIYFLGSARHHAAWLPGVADMSVPGCFAMTERGHGSNVREIETTATYDHATRTLRVHTPHDGARKEWIGNAARDGRMATVFAQLYVGGECHGVHAVLVPIRDAEGAVCSGVRIADCGEKMGLHGVDNGQLWFDAVDVPVDNLLDRFAQIDAEGQYQSPIASPTRRFFTMLGTLVGGRVSVAGAGVSVAQSALCIATRYAARRRQFGPSEGNEILLLDYTAHQRKLLPRIATTLCLTVARDALKALYDQVQRDPAAAEESRLDRVLEARAAGLKAAATRFATDTVQVCREACGGQGYAAVNRFAALKADSDVFTTFEGDNTVLELLVARGLLGDFKRQFADSRIGGFLRVLARRTTTAITQRNPIIARMSGVEHLRDLETQHDLLIARRDQLLDSAAARISSRIGDGIDPFEAVNQCQCHLLDLARAETTLWIFEQARAVKNPPPIWDAIIDLYGLSAIESNLAWFMTHGYVEPGRAEGIRDAVNVLCRKLRPHAVALVDAFDIDDHRLGAPIGRRA